MSTWRVVLVSVLTIIVSLNVRAEHIFGGDFSMVALPTQGRYLLTLKTYVDANNLVQGNSDQTAEVFIFRKRDNVKMVSVELTLQPVSPVVYENEACAKLNNLRTVEFRYTKEIILNAASFTDPEGYYVVWERCCRTNTVDNLANRGQDVGMTFRLDFPAPFSGGNFFKNSSPDFGTPNGNFICINKLFKMSMRATDADGDELRYSLVTPLQGYSTPLALYGTGQGATAYPEVKWAAGYSQTNAIQGNPALAIDAKSGLMSVKANKLGLYVFTVLVEEYRAGVKLGSVRRDFQLKVIDCNTTAPPAPVLFEAANPSKPASVVEICDGNSVDLFFQTTPDVSYQWKKDEFNIPNAKSNTLKITELGEYQVTASFTKICAVDTVSQLVRVVGKKDPSVRLTPSDSVWICKGDSVLLQVTQGADYQYTWLKDGIVLANQTTRQVMAKQQGAYIVRVSSPNFSCPSQDTVVVMTPQTPSKPLVTASKNVLCLRDSILLSTDLPAGFSLEWLKGTQVVAKNKKTYYTAQEGNYQARVFQGNCSAISDIVRVVPANTNAVVFDSLSPICFKDNLTVPLKATPSGGNFSGKSVENGVFNVQKAGVGRYPVRYEVSITGGCAVEKTRYLEVLDSPILTLPSSVTQYSSTSVVLNAQANKPTQYRYQWSPPLGISNPTVLQPTATAPQTTIYTLTATASNGCATTASIQVVVVDLLFIPDAFTPNGDGINDVWEIKNIERFPNAEVFIYNRWGELIYYQEKGYQTPWNGASAPLGEYSYVIDPHAEGGLGVQRGKVALLR